ncbi:unnamed protein product [Echinostoma caproni]|uniref:Peptidase A2 domain-containing protein n=1 Tax=Echinostoma caproni TaxID=27848 RepID=A0A183ABX4_9TREM|nr:unnamed protein product [Echinostoma caproni]
MDRESSPVQLAWFRHTIGPAALRVVNGFTYSPDEDRGYWQVVISKMEQYCFGESNETYERDIFNQRRQQHADRVNSVQLPAKQKGIFAKMLVTGEEVTFQLDSGASVNIIPKNCPPDTKLDPTQTRLVMWNDANVEPKGETTITLKNPRNGVSSVVSFVVVEPGYVPILGYESIERLGLVSFNYDSFFHHVCKDREYYLKKYASASDGKLEKLPGTDTSHKRRSRARCFTNAADPTCC